MDRKQVMENLGLDEQDVDRIMANICKVLSRLYSEPGLEVTITARKKAEKPRRRSFILRVFTLQKRLFLQK